MFMTDFDSFPEIPKIISIEKYSMLRGSDIDGKNKMAFEPSLIHYGKECKGGSEFGWNGWVGESSFSSCLCISFVILYITFDLYKGLPTPLPVLVSNKVVQKVAMDLTGAAGPSRIDSVMLWNWLLRWGAEL